MRRMLLIACFAAALLICLTVAVQAEGSGIGASCSQMPDSQARDACVVCSNQGKFNGPACICKVVAGDEKPPRPYGVSMGECVSYINHYVISPPPCDGNPPGGNCGG